MELRTRGDEITAPIRQATIGPTDATSLDRRRSTGKCALLNAMLIFTTRCSFAHQHNALSLSIRGEELVVDWRNGNHPSASTESRRQNRCIARRSSPLSMPRAVRLRCQLDSVPERPFRHCVCPGAIQVLLTPSLPDKRRFVCRSEACIEASYIFAACHIYLESW